MAVIGTVTVKEVHMVDPHVGCVSSMSLQFSIVTHGIVVPVFRRYDRGVPVSPFFCSTHQPLLYVLGHTSR